MNTLTKANLAEDVEDALGIDKYDAVYATDILVKTVKNAIFTKKLVYIPKHMKIGSSVKSERPGRNPKTGEAHTIKARHSVRGGTGAFSSMEDKLTKLSFIEELTDLGYSAKYATELVKTFYKFVGKIKDGENRIEIRGLGVFSSTYYEETPRRNPKTGETLIKEAHYKPTFKCSDPLRKAMDKEYL